CKFIIMMLHTNSKLLQYTTLASTVLIGEKITAQSVYVDIDPDVLLFEDVWSDEGWKYFDLNEDGILDVGLSYHVGFICGYCPYVIGFDVALLNGAEIATMIAPSLSLWSVYQSSYSSSVGACQIPSHAIADGLAEGEVINMDNQFGVIEELFQTFRCGSYGDFGVQNDLDFQDHNWSTYSKPYIGFQLTVPLGYQYAWLRLYEGDDYNIYVTDFGYQSHVNAGLMIEQPVTDIDESKPQSPYLFSSNGVVHVQDGTGYLMTVTDMQGKEIVEENITSSNFEKRYDLQMGIYLITIVKGDSRFTEMLMLNN
ncbi:MAG TPA: T9SS type A sorting domain-containing protein, partial [Chitinophagales bacterium]|nr:T9SS type A sorting domain-containing protein [Chitinophagales bacterium]